MNLVNIIGRRINRAVYAGLFGIALSCAFAQSVNAAPKFAVAPHESNHREKNRNAVGGENSVEKSIAVDAKVNISLCVEKGNLKITGWKRDEIRVFTADGSDVGFKIQEKNKQNKIVWLMVNGSDLTKNKGANPEECLSGETIELDVPRGATVNVKGSAGQTTIRDIRKTVVKIVDGDVSLNGIEQGIDAITYKGDVTVGDSGGAITLESANGSVVAFDVAPVEIGEIFKAKSSSGAIVLQNIGHRQTEINSNSGSIKFNGEFRSGGQYNFGTQSGTISLVIPEKSSCKINATYGFGKFDSELKYNVITENKTSRIQSLFASMGSGDANVNLTTYSGAIRIRKQEKAVLSSGFRV